MRISGTEPSSVILRQTNHLVPNSPTFHGADMGMWKACVFSMKLCISACMQIELHYSCLYVG